MKNHINDSGSRFTKFFERITALLPKLKVSDRVSLVRMFGGKNLGASVLITFILTDNDDIVGVVEVDGKPQVWKVVVSIDVLGNTHMSVPLSVVGHKK